VDPRAAGAALIVALTALHAFDLSLSRWTQNVLVAMSVALLLGFVALGLTAGSGSGRRGPLPPPRKAPPSGLSAVSLFFIALRLRLERGRYAAEEFRAAAARRAAGARRGCAGVGVIYLLVEWVFVANLTPARAGPSSRLKKSA